MAIILNGSGIISGLTDLNAGNTVTANTVTANTNAVLQGIQTTPYTGFKNRIINGEFGVFQRTSGGSSTPTAGATAYVASDRWFISQTGTVATLFQSSSASTTTGVAYSGYFGRSSGQTNVPTVIFFGQQIESKNMIDLRGQTITVSFNAFRGANAPTTLNVVCRFGTGTDQASGGGITGSWTGYSAGTTSALTIGTTVAQYTYSVTVPSNASEMNLLFYYTPTGTAGANEWFAFENVQLEKGSTATSFDYRPYGTELALCQRYYYKNLTGGTNRTFGMGFAASGTQAYTYINFPVSLRVAPTAMEQNGKANNYMIAYGGTSAACSLVPALVNSSADGCNTVWTIASGLTLGQGVQARTDVTNGATAYVAWSAEL